MTHIPADLVGQSLMLSFTESCATPDLLEALARTRACGVILFSRNIESPAGLHELCRALQAHAAAHDLPPLLIAVDQEGGGVSRLPAPFITVPSQMAQAATDDPAAAYECARISGQQLRACGVNTNFAPVLDINSNPANPVVGTRAFGQWPDSVAAFGLAALRGYRETGVVAAAKHFPGHGDTAVDSHLGLPTIHHDRERLNRVELAPFAAAIRAGVPALLTAHIVYPALDDRPATLSRRLSTDLLRGELGFAGVVFTDALDMQAITGHYGALEAAIMAKDAGADVLLPLGTLDEQMALAEALQGALRDGRLPASAFAATADRLEALRAAHQITHALPPFAEPDQALATSALAIARRGITVLGDEHGALPLAPDTRLALIDCRVPCLSLAEDPAERSALLWSLVRAAFPRAVGVVVGPDLADDDLARTRALAERGDVTLLVTRDAWFAEWQLRLAAALDVPGATLLHAAVRSPYEAALVPGAAATLLSYGDPPLSLQALVDVLAGTARAQGCLPIDLPRGTA